MFSHHGFIPTATTFVYSHLVSLKEFMHHCYPTTAGPTYCAVASMELMGVLDKVAVTRRQGLLEWCLNRQVYQSQCADSYYQARFSPPLSISMIRWIASHKFCVLYIMSMLFYYLWLVTAAYSRICLYGRSRGGSGGPGC